VSKKPELNQRPGKTKFSQQVGDMAERKLQAQRHVTKTVWSGLGMMGLVGWSVVMPTLLGAALGLWLDERYPGGHSWTLALLAIGLGLGCVNAWHWIAKEDREIHQDEIENNSHQISEAQNKVDENKHE
jgi:ATP synthase protein I